MKKDSNSFKIIILCIIALFLLVPVSFASSNYSIPHASIYLNATDDGTSVISEDITYDINNEINGVYREIPYSGQQSIENVSVETPGYYNTVEVIKNDTTYTIKVWLYKDEAKTQKVSDDKVEVIYHYNFIKGIKIYNDIAELQYKPWGSEWDTQVDVLETYVQLPGSNSSVEYWNNPTTYLRESTWTNETTLKSVFEDIPSHKYQEQRFLMPKEYFRSTENADVINKDAKETIEKQQEDYSNQIAFNQTIGSILTIIGLLLLVSPVGVYFKYGREPKTMYKADYEYDLPTDDSPIFVNMLVSKNVGEINENAFSAVVLDLMDKKYYTVMHASDKDTIIRRTDKDESELKLYELDVLNHLKNYEDSDKNISLKAIKDDRYSRELKSFKSAWEIDLKKESSKIDKIFDSKGSTYFVGICVALIIYGFIVLLISNMLDLSSTFLFSILLIACGFIFIKFVSNKIFGRWTVEGKETYDKWKNFGKYIQDYSLIKEYPPASVQVWGKYLVYATALGLANKTIENMKRYCAEYQMEDYFMSTFDLYIFSYYGGFYMLDGFSHSVYNPPSDSSSSYGDIGNVGGGFGGGGGGTF